MKIIYAISFIILFIFPARLLGQYVCYDNDGYINIRNGPGTQYEIVDRVSKYEIFYSSDWICGDMYPLDASLTWMPFARSIYDNLDKFVFRKNIRSLDDMPQLWADISEDGMLLSCSNDTISINLVLKDFDVNNHVIKDTTQSDGTKIIQSINGVRPKGIYPYLGIGEEITGKEISALYIEKGNKRTNLPIDAIKEYFNPGMIVFFGHENELYIYISVGDASDSYSIYLSVVDGIVKYALEYSAC